MFKFITLMFICLIAFSGVAEATKLHASNKAALRAEAKTLLKALEAMQQRIAIMEENGEDVDFDLGKWFNGAVNKVKGWFH